MYGPPSRATTTCELGSSTLNPGLRLRLLQSVLCALPCSHLPALWWFSSPRPFQIGVLGIMCCGKKTTAPAGAMGQTLIVQQQVVMQAVDMQR